MLLIDLFEAENDDRAAREEANAAFDAIHDWVDGRKDYFADAVSRSDALGGSFVFKAEGAGVSNNDDLLIVLSPKQAGGVRGAFGHAGLRPLIMLAALRAPNDPLYVETRMASMRGVFVHEWMHYRAWSSRKQPNKSSVEMGSGSPAYYNHAEELNSYYQEAVDGFYRLVKNVIGFGHHDTAMEMWGSRSTPELTHYIVVRELNKDFRDNLTPANLQRVKKRISRFVEETIRPLFAGLDHRR